MKMTSFHLKMHFNFKTMLHNTKKFPQLVKTLSPENLCHFLMEIQPQIRKLETKITLLRNMF